MYVSLNRKHAPRKLSVFFIEVLVRDFKWNQTCVKQQFDVSLDLYSIFLFIWIVCLWMIRLTSEISCSTNFIVS